MCRGVGPIEALQPVTAQQFDFSGPFDPFLCTRVVPL